MVYAYQTDADGHITMTCAPEFGEGLPTFEFPADFDFGRQSFWKIVGGELVEDTAKREAEEERRREEAREAGRMEAQLLYTALMTDTLLEG